MNRIKKINNKGVTLAEVMVALSVISIITIIFIQLYSVGNKANMKSKQRLDALIQAQNVIETLKVSDELVSGTTDTNYNNFKIRQVVDSEEYTTNGELYNVTVIVTTPDVGDIVLETKLYRPVGDEDD